MPGIKRGAVEKLETVNSASVEATLQYFKRKPRSWAQFEIKNNKYNDEKHTMLYLSKFITPKNNNRHLDDSSNILLSNELFPDEVWQKTFRKAYLTSKAGVHKRDQILKKDLL